MKYTFTQWFSLIPVTSLSCWSRGCGLDTDRLSSLPLVSFWCPKWYLLCDVSVFVWYHTYPWKCPILFFKAYMRVRPKGAEAFFCTRGGKSISPKRVNAVLKQTCEKAGLNVSLYSSHGLRGGGATEAASKGINCRLIMRHGNWRSLAVYIYIHDDMSDRLAVSAAI